MRVLVLAVLNAATVLAGLALTVTVILGNQFAINEFRLVHNLAPKPASTAVLIQAWLIPVVFIAVFVVPSVLLLRHGRPVLAAIVALMPSVPSAALLALIYSRI